MDFILPIIDSIFKAIIILGSVLFGWWLRPLADKRNLKRRQIDEFYTAISFQLDRLATITESVDSDSGTFTQDIFRSLERHAYYVERHHKEKWKQVHTSWVGLKEITGKKHIASIDRDGKPRPFYINREAIKTRLTGSASRRLESY